MNGHGAGKVWENMPTTEGSDKEDEPRPGLSGSSATGNEFLTLMKDFMAGRQKWEQRLLK